MIQADIPPHKALAGLFLESTNDRWYLIDVPLPIATSDSIKRLQSINFWPFILLSRCAG